MLPDMRWMQKVTLDEWQWALSVIWSRAFSLGNKGGALIPLADMFNMASPADEAKLTPLAQDKLENGGVGFYAATDISKGSQIFVQYGGGNPLPNAQLLLDYGFIFDTSPYDVAILRLSLSENDPLAKVLWSSNP